MMGRKLRPHITSGISIPMASRSLTTEILNPQLSSTKTEIAREFQEAEPFRHVVVPDFLSPEFAKRMLDDFPSFEDRYAIGETGDVGRKAEHRDVRDISDAYREIDEFIQTSEFLDFMSEVSGIPGLMYDPEYHGGGTHENVNGASLYTHVDFNYHPKGWHRRLNLIVYLTPEWQVDWGGNLELHSDPWDPAADSAKLVPTRFNQAVLFETTESSWHGFRPIRLPEDHQNLSRKSFAIYLYTKDRPAEQTAASHNTIYIPFGMPEEIKAGTTLTKEQDHLLQSRFVEYRHMLRLQYDRQLYMSQEFERAYRLDLQGYGVETRAPNGRWPDGWVSTDFSMEFRATRPVRAVVLEIKISENIDSEQVLEIQAGDWSGTDVGQPGEDRTLTIPVSVNAGETLEVNIHASTSASPPGGIDTRQLAWWMASATLEH
jgi:Rps23 Pro-64 3,4-dihydroxylase Tpa1-like proline 4-hydroxylase